MELFFFCMTSLLFRWSHSVAMGRYIRIECEGLNLCTPALINVVCLVDRSIRKKVSLPVEQRTCFINLRLPADPLRTRHVSTSQRMRSDVMRQERREADKMATIRKWSIGCQDNRRGIKICESHGALEDKVII